MGKETKKTFFKVSSKKSTVESLKQSEKYFIFFLRVTSVTYLMSEPLEMVAMRPPELIRPFIGQASHDMFDGTKVGRKGNASQTE